MRLQRYRGHIYKNKVYENNICLLNWSEKWIRYIKVYKNKGRRKILVYENKVLYSKWEKIRVIPALNLAYNFELH